MSDKTKFFLMLLIAFIAMMAMRIVAGRFAH
jgi:hypothetical protein